jgi:hypothetical protein
MFFLLTESARLRPRTAAAFVFSGLLLSLSGCTDGPLGNPSGPEGEGPALRTFYEEFDCPEHWSTAQCQIFTEAMENLGEHDLVACREFGRAYDEDLSSIVDYTDDPGVWGIVGWDSVPSGVELVSFEHSSKMWEDLNDYSWSLQVTMSMYFIAEEGYHSWRRNPEESEQVAHSMAEMCAFD